jgi:tetratricopeptide (TPR) repeat protein
MRFVLACLAAVAAMPLSAPAVANWYRASSQHFVIYSEQKPKSLHNYAEELERFDQAVRLIHGMQEQPFSKGNRVTIFDVGIDKVQQLLHDDSGMIAGFYHGSVEGSVAFVSRSNPIQFQVSTGELTPKVNNAEFGPDTVLLHEYSHHLMAEDLNRPYPQWLEEGFAEFMSQAEFKPDGSIEIGRPQATYRFGNLMYGDQVPLETLLSGKFDKLDREQFASLYSRAWLLTHYLTFDPTRKGQLDAYVAALSKGIEPLQAARQTFGDLGKLEHDLDAYFTEGYFHGSKRTALNVPAKDLKDVPVEVSALSDGATRILPILMRVKAPHDENHTADIANDARSVEQQFRGDPLVETTLAEAELDHKDFKDAEAAATRALAADPQSTDAMILEGRAKVRELAGSKGSATDFDEARTWFLKANKIDPEDPEPLYRFYESFVLEGTAPTQNAVAALHYASDLAPQDSEVRIESAAQYLAQGKIKDARAALVPVAYDPHGEEVAKRARTMIDKLDAGDTKAALAAAAPPKDPKSKSN